MREREVNNYRRFSPTRIAKNIAIAGLTAVGIAEGAASIRSAVIEDQRLNAIVREYPHHSFDQSAVFVESVIESPTGILFGVSPHNNDINEALELTKEYNIPITSVNYFLDRLEGRSMQIDTWIQEACSRSVRPMISWGNVRYMNQFEEYESHIRNFARQLASYDCIIDLRMFFEMNGNWFDYGSASLEPSEFVHGWRRIHQIFVEEQAENVQFVFSPNSTINAAPIEPYYPGSDVVDIVGGDFYNIYDHIPLRSISHYVYPNISAEALLGPDLQTLRRIAPDKPLYITEIGIMYEEQNHQWLRDAIGYAAEFGVDSIMVFSWNKAGAGWNEDNWRVQDNPYVLSVFQDYFSYQRDPSILLD